MQQPAYLTQMSGVRPFCFERPEESIPPRCPPCLRNAAVYFSFSRRMPSVETPVTPRVLVVEDEQKTRDSLVEGLRLETWNVAACASGTEAIRLIEREPF